MAGAIIALSRRGCLDDDDSAKPGTLRAANVRAPHAHVDMVRIDPSAADKMRVVRALPSGVDAKILATLSVPCTEAAR